MSKEFRTGTPDGKPLLNNKPMTKNKDMPDKVFIERNVSTWCNYTITFERMAESQELYIKESTVKAEKLALLDEVNKYVDENTMKHPTGAYKCNALDIRISENKHMAYGIKEFINTLKSEVQDD